MDFKNRRSVRAYSDRVLTDEMLNSMLEEAFHAPNTGNMQLYSVVVTRSPEGRNALAPAHFNQPMVQTCQAVLTFCADTRRFTRWCELSDAQPVFDNLQSLAAAVFDAVIAAQQFCSIAEHRGLGCCYLGTTTYNAREIAQALNLPPLTVPVLTVTVGYPAEPLPPMTDRLPAYGLIHREEYVEPTDVEIRDLYAEKEAREDSRGFVAENGKQTLAQVFTDVRYPGSSSEHFSATFCDFLKEQGFRIG